MINLQLKEAQKLQRIKVNDKRYYIIPDSTVAYPSVTTVLSDYNKQKLEKWIKSVGEKEADRQKNFAATHGSDLHNCAENFILGVKTNKIKNPFAQVRFRPIQKILQDNVTEVYGVEPAMYSHVLKLAGSIDLVAKFNGKNTILDYKTSKRTKQTKDIPHYFMQTAIYAAMVYELWGIKIEQLIIVISCDDNIDTPSVFVEPVSKWINKAMEFIKDSQYQPINITTTEYMIEQ